MPVTSAASDIRAGTVAWFAASTAPAGFIKANGAAVSRTLYGALFNAIGTTYGVGDGSTTFNVPDLRGEFLRGMDDGRGVDSGRTIGTAQAGQNASHTHTMQTAGAASGSISGGNGVGDFGTFNAATGVFSLSGAAPNRPQGSAGGGSSTTQNLSIPAHAHTVDANGGTETRPRNVALLACIKF